MWISLLSSVGFEKNRWFDDSTFRSVCSNHLQQNDGVCFWIMRPTYVTPGVYKVQLHTQQPLLETQGQTPSLNDHP